MQLKKAAKQSKLPLGKEDDNRNIMEHQEVLEGRIEHRLHLSPSNLSTRKRQRTSVSESAAAASSTAANNTETTRTAPSLTEAGFYLVVEYSDSSKSTVAYLLSVPHHHLKTVCDAARFYIKVRVSHYTNIPLLLDCPLTPNSEVDSGNESRKRKSVSNDDSESSPATAAATELLEIHDHGLALLSNPNQIPKDKSVFLTLKQVFEAEDKKANSNDNKERANSSSSNVEKGKKHRKRRYSFQATVDSISPIMFVEEPFALMELFDENNNNNNNEPPYSCVVVFQGAASLVCHDAILPGDDICLVNCKRQRWKIPEVLQKENHQACGHLKHRIPSHVFVFQNPQDILWGDASSASSSTSTTAVALLPHNISTPVPLVSLQGRVVSKEWASRGGDTNTYMMHAIEIETWQQQQQQHVTKNETATARHILFLTYYPMSPTLALSLRPGVVILAVNIHCIGSSFANNKTRSMSRLRTNYYGACLRSTVTILQMAPSPKSQSGSSISMQPSQVNGTIRDAPVAKYYPSKPCAVISIPRSYLEYACRKELYRWFYTKENFHASKEQELPGIFDTLFKLWWDHHCARIECTRASSSSTRNPYFEFFDHAHADNEILAKEETPVEDSDSEPSSSMSQPMKGCHCSRTQSTSNSGRETTLLPCWISLHDVQNVGIRSMQDRLLEKLNSNQQTQGSVSTENPHIGWTTSINLAAADVLGYRSDKESNRCPLLYTGGQVIACETRSIESRFDSASLANNVCILPANTITGNPVPTSPSVSSSQRVTASFAFGLLDSVIVSCFCAKTIAKAKTTASNSSYCENRQTSPSFPLEGHFLPRNDNQTPLEIDGSSNDSKRGASFLWETGKYLFVVSVQLLFKELVPVSLETVDALEDNTTTTSVPASPRYVTVQQCLDPQVSETCQGAQSQNIRIIGTFTRQRLRLSKIASSCYRGYILTLNHVAIDFKPRHGIRSVTTPQTIEVKTEIQYHGLDRKRKLLKQIFSKLNLAATLGSMDDAIHLVLAWWKIADSVDSCALASSGWDDYLRVAPEALSPGFVVVVDIPGTAAQIIEARGYQRFACRLSGVKARFVSIHSEWESAATILDPHWLQSTSSLFDAIGGFKFLPGTLDRRPLRRIQQADYHAEKPNKAKGYHMMGERMMLASVDLSGIPDCNLEFLIRCVCLDLQRQERSLGKRCYLAPSLVRKVPGARLLGISFCRAQVTCTRCFQALRQPKNAEKKHKTQHSETKENPQKSWEEQKKQPSFWHCPLPIPGSYNRAKTSGEVSNLRAGSVQRPSTAKERSALCCPNGCDVGASAEVKWECSGTLDDGTAQAKLYAERQAAVMLLGVNQETADCIEEGAWMHPGGCIGFSKTAPPPSHLAKAVEAANFRYAAREQNLRQRRRGARSKNESGMDKRSEILRMLDPIDRALYLMYTHCRHSKVATRELDYLVRCKPLADNILHLNHTEIDVVAPGAREGTLSSHHGATYSLPPLKLVLVDACVPTARSCGAILVEETWDLLRNLRQEVYK